MSLKNNSYFIIILIILLFNEILNATDEVIYLEFKSLYNDGEFIDNTIISQLFQRRIYSKIIIGEPEHEIKILLSPYHSYFALTPLHLENKEGILVTDYNYKESKSFQNVSSPMKILESEDIFAKEKIKLGLFNYKKKEYKEIIINDFDFIFCINQQYMKNPYFVNLGLEFLVKKSEFDVKKYNLIYQLKSKKITNSYYLSFEFDKGENNNGTNLYNLNKLFNSTGKILIGDLTDYYQFYNFSKNQFLSIYSFRKDTSPLLWTIKFDDFYYKYGDRTYSLNVKVANFDLNNFIIQGPYSYDYEIKYTFFNKYINKDVCHRYTDVAFETYYFDKSDNFNISDLQTFPTLHFKSNDLQYTFELNYEDLFVEKDGKFWFLIVFPTQRVSEWYFGTLFLRKYNLLFNYDSKTMGFYNPNLPKGDDPSGENPDNSNSLTIKICIAVIVVLSVLSVGLGIYISKICYNKKKTKARLNEIEENFEYESKDNFKKEEIVSDSQSNLIGV